MRNPFRLFQQLTRSYSSGRDDVRAITLSLRNVEDLLAERGIDISHETVRFWWNGLVQCSPIMPGRADYLVELRGFEPLTSGVLTKFRQVFTQGGTLAARTDSPL
jgi:hypothetical protein